MKFGHLLYLEEQAAPKELQGHFIQYKTLKKMLKRRLKTTSAQEHSTSLAQPTAESEKEFLRLLRGQLKEVDKKFSAVAEAVLSRYDTVGGKQSRNDLCALLRRALGPNQEQSTESLAKLQQRVFWTKKYAELNATALRKIAKKRDKLCGGKVGQAFMQACFRGQIAIQALLSLPLLRELTAVELLLSQQLSPLQPAQAQNPRLQASAPEPAEAMQLLPTEASLPEAEGLDTVAVDVPRVASADQELERDYTCSICMDVLYKPVALECGHIYCARCAISTAVGHDKTIGDADRLLSTLAAYTAAYANRACPDCRSTVYGKVGESVFWRIRRMNHLDRLIQQKYPEEWQRRKMEDHEDQTQLKAKRAEDSLFKKLPCCGQKPAQMA